jgi:integrase
VETGWKSKGRRARVIPLSVAAQDWLAQARARWGGEGYVLHDRPTPPLTTNWCGDTRAACSRAGLPPVDTHGLRRTAGVLWIAAGIDIYTVSSLLGHASVITTEKAYAGIADSRLNGVFDSIDARSGTARPAPAAPTSHQAGTTRDLFEAGDEHAS